MITEKLYNIYIHYVQKGQDFSHNKADPFKSFVYLSKFRRAKERLCLNENIRTWESNYI